MSARIEAGLEQDQPRIVFGTRGIGAKKFARRFPNEAAMIRWLDDPQGDEVDVLSIEKA